MMEMLMLLGAGLVAAGLAGMSGILPQMGHAEAGPGEASDSGLGEGESKDLLGRIREMGLLPDFGSNKTPADADAAETVLDPIAAFEETDGFDMAEFIAETGTVFDEDMDEDEDDEDVLSILADPADPADPVSQTDDEPEAASEDVGAAQAADDTDVNALLARLGTIDEAEATEETGEDSLVAPLEATADDMHDELAEDEASDDEDDIPVITDFIAGEDSLMLMMPEDMDDDTAIRIEPAGETGADAAIVLEDARGSLTAAVIRGGFGSVTPEDIELERAA